MMTFHHFQDDRLAAVLERREQQFRLTLTDRASGQQWGPSPLLSLEIYSKAEFRTDTVLEYRIDAVEPVENGVHLIIGDARRHVRLGLWLRIEQGELVVRLPLPEVYEDRPETRRLFSVILLPDLMTTDAGGELFLPLNTGCLTRPANKPALADRFMIYGEQPRWELLPTLPVCAARRSTGGLMALATGGAAETECHVATDGAGGGRVGFGMNLRQYWPDPVEWETREIRYRPIPPADDFLGNIAQRLRRHVTDDLGKPTLKQRCQECPDLEYLLHGYIMKLFFAVENCGIMMENKEKTDWVTFRQVMNFAEAEAGLQRLHAAGVARIYTQSVGFNANGHDGLYPTLFPIEERLGGEAGFRRLLATGHALGYQMNVHDNKKAAVRRSPDFCADAVVHDQWGNPMGLGEWGGGTTFVRNTRLVSPEALAAEMRGLQALGLTGMGYLDGMGNPLYRNYHPRDQFSRTAYARMTNRLVAIAKQVYGAAGTECGFMYCAIPADCMCTGGELWQWNACRPDWPVTRLMDQRVPLYRLVFSGLMFQECHGVSWRTVQECVLLGKHPRDEWSARPGVMPVLTDERIAKLKAIYDIALQRFGHLQAEQLLTWQATDGVESTTYADGTTVTADFTAGRLTVNGEDIPKPAVL